jgi:hypothetical protein
MIVLMPAQPPHTRRYGGPGELALLLHPTTPCVRVVVVVVDGVPPVVNTAEEREVDVLVGLYGVPTAPTVDVVAHEVRPVVAVVLLLAGLCHVDAVVGCVCNRCNTNCQSYGRK